MAEDVLAGYVGEYAISPAFKITVTREGTQLYVQATGQPRFEVYAETETKFFLKVVDAQITFDVDEEGKANQLTLFQGGQTAPAKRVN